jgi:hypothetical protein
MASRHEEKYIISYSQYAMLLQRARQVLTPDVHGNRGSYVITSLYYDDYQDHALLEKLDGLPEHRKFRIRTYDYSENVIKLERKDKHGILTKKADCALTPAQLRALSTGTAQLGDFTGKAYDLAAQMLAEGLRPSVTVRYRRDAFTFAGSDLRLTFDIGLEAIAPVERALFDGGITGIPVLGGNEVIMEIKYGNHCPAFLRRLTDVSSTQLSVSKYALCRERII